MTRHLVLVVLDKDDEGLRRMLVERPHMVAVVREGEPASFWIGTDGGHPLPKTWSTSSILDAARWLCRQAATRVRRPARG